MASWIGIVLCTIYYTVLIIWPFAVCLPKPGQSAGTALITKGCDNQRTLAWAKVPFNIVTDFYLVIIPVPVIIKLQMSRAKKLRVCVVFAFGLL